jgi:predicted hotdog family 3-hydroxylacyl-ACP dehydratase
MKTGSPIAKLLPQAGAMVLLDEVVSHDERRIVCRANSHRDPSNPLMHDGALPVWAGIEYAAQAMAAHFSLSADVRGETTIGLLGGLRDVVCEVSRLDDTASLLIVEAERLSHDAAGSIYGFRVSAEDDRRTLLQGRATVVQQRTLTPAPPAALPYPSGRGEISAVNVLSTIDRRKNE